MEISFLAAEIAFAAAWLLVRAGVWIKQRGPDWKREAVLLLMFVNLAVIIRFVFFPRAMVDGHIQPLVFDADAIFPLRVNLIPLVHLFRYAGVRDILWNVAGQYGDVRSRRHRSARRIQKAGQFPEGDGGRRADLAVHRMPAAAFRLQSFGHRRSDPQHAGNGCRIRDLRVLQAFRTSEP